MGWKGTLRTIAASQRRAEREAERRRRELNLQRQRLGKMQERERAAFEYQEFENYIDLLLSVHREASEEWDWQQIRCSVPPDAPTPFQYKGRETAARITLAAYQPSLTSKLLKRAAAERSKLADAVEIAIREDEREYQQAREGYEQDYRDWEAQCEHADRMLARDPEAYIDAIRQTDPFSDIRELGSSIEFRVEKDRLVEATLRANGEKVVPSQTKNLLQSGKLSTKPMPKGRFYEMYQDHICSCVLRIARELFALLPIEMTVVTAVGDLLNTQTGHMEEKPILSVAIPRDTLETLNIDGIDPSDSMSNFVHRMDYRKTKGFRAVEALRPSDLQLP